MQATVKNQIKENFNIKTKEGLLNFLLFGCFVCQFLITLYFNLFEVDNHLGIDSSWDYLKTMLVARNGGLYPIDYISDTTAPLIDRQFILAMPLYMILKNINLAYALTNLVFTVAIIYNIVKLLKTKDFGTNEILFVINLFICPFMLNDFVWHNDLGYFSIVLGMAAMYSIRVLQFILALRVLTNKSTKLDMIPIFVLSGIISVFSGVGSGMSMMAMLFLPLLVSRFVLAFVENDWSVLKGWQSIYVYLNIVLIVAGRFCGAAVGLTYRDSIEKWITADKLWENLGNQLAGFLLLGGVIPRPDEIKSPVSLSGIVHVFGIVIFTAMFVGFLFCIKKVILNVKEKNVDVCLLTLVTLVITTIIEFWLLDTKYGETVFECRYLLIAFISGFFFLAYFIKAMDKKQIFRSFGLAVLFVSIVCTDLVSDYNYKRNTNEEYCMAEMTEYVKSTDAGLVYAWGTDCVLYERCMRVYDIDRVYKLIKDDGALNDWGDYTYYNDSTQYDGPTVLMTPEDFTGIPNDILREYEYVTTIHKIKFYYSKTNPINLKRI